MTWRWRQTSPLQLTLKDIRWHGWILLDTFLIDLWLNPPEAWAIHLWVFPNNLLASHLHAAPSTNIYLRMLSSCVRREAAPPFCSSLTSNPSSLASPSLSLCSQLVSSPEVNSSCGRWPVSFLVHSPASPLVAVEKHPGERLLSSSLC